MYSPPNQSIQEPLDRKRQQFQTQSLPPEAISALRRALRYIHENLYDPQLSVAQVRERCDISVNTFSQRFRARLGHTPHRYIQHRRIEVACALFERGVDNVFLVGLSVGYNRYRTFLRNFKGVTGRTPSEYLDSRRSEPEDE